MNLITRWALEDYIANVCRYRPEDNELLEKTRARGKELAQCLPAGVTAIVSRTGLGHGLYIGSDGNLYGWGDNTHGQVGIESERVVPIPVQIPLPEGVTPIQISAGGFHSMMLDMEGDVYVWGDNSACQIGNKNNKDRCTPAITRLAHNERAIAIIAGRQRSVAKSDDNKVYVWGDNMLHALYIDERIVISSPYSIGTACTDE